MKRGWWIALAVVVAAAAARAAEPARDLVAAAGQLPAVAASAQRDPRQALVEDVADVRITAADCTAAKSGTSIPTSAIGEPVRAITLSEPSWVEAANDVPPHCRVNGTMAPIDPSSTSRPINFSVVLPSSWSRRAAQLGGGGMNGVIPNLTGGPGGTSLLARSVATYGSDSGHQASFGRRGGPPGASGAADDWALNAEAIANLCCSTGSRTARHPPCR